VNANGGVGGDGDFLSADFGAHNGGDRAWRDFHDAVAGRARKTRAHPVPGSRRATAGFQAPDIHLAGSDAHDAGAAHATTPAGADDPHPGASRAMEYRFAFVALCLAIQVFEPDLKPGRRRFHFTVHRSLDGQQLQRPEVERLRRVEPKATTKERDFTGKSMPASVVAMPCRAASANPSTAVC